MQTRLKKGIVPLEHQLEFVKFSNACDYTLLGDMMGLARPSQLY